MNTKFTQGVWESDNKGSVYVGEKCIALCQLHDILLDEVDANAELISLSPEMHKMLTTINNHIFNSKSEVELANNITNMCHDIDYLLSKVKLEEIV